MPEPPPRPSLLIQPPWIERTAPIDRFLRLFTTVHEGEGFSAILLALNAFTLLAVFFLLKTLREALILAEGGAEVKSYAAALQALILIGSVLVYGVMASRMDRVRLVNTVTGFAIMNLAAFSVLTARGRSIAVPFYLWLGIFNLLVIAQFWGFASDVYTEEQGKRLFAVIGLGGIAGSLVGSQAGGMLLGRWGAAWVLGGAAALLTLSLGLTFLVNRYVCACGGPQSVIASLPIGRSGGFSVLLSSRYLMLVAVLTMVVNMSSTAGDFLLGKVVQAEAESSAGAEARVAWIGQYYSRYFLSGSILAFILQLAVGARLLAWLGPVRTLFILPLFSLTGYGLILGLGQTSLFPLGRLIEVGIDASVQTVAGHALFLGTSREAKYKAKAAIDAFFWRTGDLLHAGLVWIGTRSGFTVTRYFWLNLALVMVWLGVVVLLDRENRREKAGRPRWRVLEV